MIPNEAQPIRRAIQFTAAVTLVRLAWLALGVIGMSGDETYYWDWGRHLDWGYFSKPPMIAWVNALVDMLCGGHAFGFKAVAAIITGAGTCMLALVAAEAFGGRAALRAAVIASVTIGMLASASIFNTDGMLMLAWNTAMWLTLRCWKHGGGWADYAALAVVLGLGALSKQMMLVFPLTAGLALWAAGKGRVSLPGFITASLLSLTALFPPLLWNARNGWITLKHTEHHFQTAAFDPLKIAGRIAGFLGTQAGLLTPLLFVLLLVVIIGAIRSWRNDRPSLLLLWFSLPGLLVCLVMLFRQNINPNWPAVFWSGALVLAAGREWRAWFKWPGVAVSTGAAIVAGTMLVTAATGRLPVLRPEKRLWNGWQEAADKVAARISELTDGKPRLLIVTGHRFAASQMAFRLPGQPKVYFHDKKPGITSQYDFWQPSAAEMKLPVVVIAFGAKPLPPGLASALRNPSPGGGEITVSGLDKKTAKFQIYTADTLEHWPTES